MKIIKELINNDKDLLNLCGLPNQDVLFFDIETTGFHRTRTRLYMMGYIYFDKGHWCLEQHFADEFEDEKTLLTEFIKLAESKKLLISFNGDSFDLPYLYAKFERYCIHKTLNVASLDLYKIVRNYKKLLNLPNYKLKTIEKLVGIYREDPFTGGDLIEQYHFYMEKKDHRLEYNLLLHNKEDMIALLNLMDIYDIFNSLDTLATFKVKDLHLEAHQFKIVLQPEKSIPVPLNLTIQERIHIQLDKHVTIQGETYTGELKYFFPDYKNYFYIEDKDEALHKSIANFLPTNKKKKAKASTCYTKHENQFVPLLNGNTFKVFRSDYKSKALFTPSSLFNDPKGIHDFSMHVIQQLLPDKPS